MKLTNGLSARCLTAAIAFIFLVVADGKRVLIDARNQKDDIMLLKQRREAEF
jgi:hypothetical protein